jgi:hypothetical protein
VPHRTNSEVLESGTPYAPGFPSTATPMEPPDAHLNPRVHAASGAGLTPLQRPEPFNHRDRQIDYHSSGEESPMSLTGHISAAESISSPESATHQQSKGTTFSLASPPPALTPLTLESRSPGTGREVVTINNRDASSVSYGIDSDTGMPYITSNLPTTSVPAAARRPPGVAFAPSPAGTHTCYVDHTSLTQPPLAPLPAAHPYTAQRAQSAALLVARAGLPSASTPA